MQPKEKTNVINQETTTSLITHDTPVRYDFQGWAEYQTRVIDLLRVLNIPTDNISKDILKRHVSICEDDGMGYCSKQYKPIDCNVNNDELIIWI